jgi:hypothetical protein
MMRVRGCTAWPEGNEFQRSNSCNSQPTAMSGGCRLQQLPQLIPCWRFGSLASRDRWDPCINLPLSRSVHPEANDRVV